MPFGISSILMNSSPHPGRGGHILHRSAGGLDTCVALQLAAEVSRREAAEGNNAEAEGWAEAARVQMKSRPLINRRGSEGNPAGGKNGQYVWNSRTAIMYHLTRFHFSSNSSISPFFVDRWLECRLPSHSNTISPV